MIIYSAGITKLSQIFDKCQWSFVYKQLISVYTLSFLTFVSCEILLQTWMHYLLHVVRYPLKSSWEGKQRVFQRGTV